MEDSKNPEESTTNSSLKAKGEKLVKMIVNIIKNPEKIMEIFLFQLKQFAFPLIIKSNMLKVRRSLSIDDFKDEESKLKEEGISVRTREMNESIQIKNFILRRDGSLELPYRYLIFLGRFWLGIPALIWIVFDIVFILYFCFDSFQIIPEKFMYLILLCGSLYTVIALYCLIQIHSEDIKKLKLGKEIYPCWIFITFPLIIGLYEFAYGGYHDITDSSYPGIILNPGGIVTLFIITLFLYFWFKTVYLDEYLEALPEVLKKYENIRRKIGGEIPICWIMVASPLADISNQGTHYISLYFRNLRKVGNTSNENPKKRFANRLKKSILDYFEKYRFILGIKDEKVLEENQKKLIKLRNTPIDDENMNLLLPYVANPAQTLDRLSGYCLINYSEQRILGINLPKEVADSMAEEANLWKAKNLKDVVSSFLTYHSDVISKMKTSILNPVDPLIDPSRMRRDLDAIKNYISSLICLDGLLDSFNQILMTENQERIPDKLEKMNKEFKRLKKKHREFLESSSTVLEAENAENIKNLNRKVFWLTVLLLILSFSQIIFGNGYPFRETFSEAFSEAISKPPGKTLNSIGDLINCFFSYFGLSITSMALLTLLLSEKHFKKMIILAILPYVAIRILCPLLA